MIYNTIYAGTTYEVFAFIKVTYPSGYTCTCSNGSQTIYAEDTSGSYAVGVPSAGRWTISCPGSSITPKYATIVTEGTVMSVTLS